MQTVWIGNQEVATEELTSQVMNVSSGCKNCSRASRWSLMANSSYWNGWIRIKVLLNLDVMTAALDDMSVS